MRTHFGFGISRCGLRAGYYDTTGAVKDMVQNHLLQILSIVALDDPAKNLSEEQFKEFCVYCIQ